MFDLLSPDIVETQIENIARLSPRALRPQLIAFIFSAVYLLVLSRGLRFGLLHLDWRLADRARAAGREPAFWNFAIGHTAIWNGRFLAAILAIIAVAECWLTIGRFIDFGHSDTVVSLNTAALSVSRWYW